VSSCQSRSDKLYNQINSTLQKTDARKWRLFGGVFDPKALHTRPRDYWEHLYTLQTPQGHLVLRSSMEVSSKFFRGGYKLTPVEEPVITVEKRELSWNPRELTDPFYRGVMHSGCRVLVQGEMAIDFFSQVADVYGEFQEKLEGVLEEDIGQLLEGLEQVIANSKYHDWERVISGLIFGQAKGT